MKMTRKKLSLILQFVSASVLVGCMLVLFFPPLEFQLEEVHQLSRQQNISISASQCSGKELNSIFQGIKNAAPLTAVELYILFPELKRAVEIYPTNFIKRYVDKVFFCGSIEDESGHRYLGQYSSEKRMIVIADPEFPDRTFHHELSSFLVQNQADSVENFYRSWLTLGDDKGYLGTEAALNQKGPLEELYEKGFISYYGRSTPENDVNVYAEMMFSRPNDLKKISQEYPRVAAKVAFLKDFYIKTDPHFEGLLSLVGL